MELNNSKEATIPIGDPICIPVKVPIAQQGRKPLPGQKPPGAKKPAAKTKKISYNTDSESDDEVASDNVDDDWDDEIASDDVDGDSEDAIALDTTSEEFAGYFSPVTSDDYLASSGASLDDGSTPGSVTWAFDDPELIAMQDASDGDNANSNSGLNNAESNPTGDVIASATTGSTTENLGWNDESSADEPPYQFFLDDGSGNNPTGNLALNSGSPADRPLYQDFLDDGSSGSADTNTSGDVASNAGTSTDSPFYDAFLDDASTAGAGVFFSSPEDDALLSSSSPAGGDVSLFDTDSADLGTDPSADNQVAGLTSLPELSSGDISGSSLETDPGTSGSEPNLFMEGSDTDPGGLLAEGEAPISNDDADPSLFTDGGLTGTDVFSNTARKVRRQKARNPYPDREG